MKPIKSPGMDSRSGSDLRPSLTRLNAVALVAGTIIGASIFVQPSEIAQHLNRPVDIMLVWLACGVLTLFGALVCAALASAFPRTGGRHMASRPEALSAGDQVITSLVLGAVLIS